MIRSAERSLRRVTNITSASEKCSVTLLNHMVRSDIGSEDVFNLGEHIAETQDGIDNHHFCLLSLVVGKFHKLRQYHIAKTHTLKLQSRSLRKKLSKTILFQGY